MKNKVKVLDVGDYVCVDNVKLYEKFRKIQKDHGYRLPPVLDENVFHPVVLYWNGECLMANRFIQRNLIGLSEFVVRLSESYGSSERLVLKKGDCINVRYPVEFEIIRGVVKSYGYGFFETYRKFQSSMGFQYIEWGGSSVRGSRKRGERVLSFSEFMSKLDNSFLMDRVVRWRTELNYDQRLNYALISGIPQVYDHRNLDEFSDETIIAIYTTLRSENIAAW